MTIEEIEAIYEARDEGYYNEGLKNKVFKALSILAKYSDDIQIVPDHDQLWIGITNEQYENITEEDVNAIFDLNFSWEEDSFHTNL